MAKFPEPPGVAALAALGPDIHVMPAGTRLARIFFRGGPHPVSWKDFRHWGPGGSRFDHHLPDAAGQPHLQPRGILYAAGKGRLDPLSVCAAEVFQATRIVDRNDCDPWFVLFETTRDLRLLDLAGPWTTRAGASAAISSGAKARARRWAREIYEAFPALDGLLYLSSMGGNAPAVALTDRAGSALPPDPLLHRALADPVLRAPLIAGCQKIGYRLL